MPTKSVSGSFEHEIEIFSHGRSEYQLTLEVEYSVVLGSAGDGITCPDDPDEIDEFEPKITFAAGYFEVHGENSLVPSVQELQKALLDWFEHDKQGKKLRDQLETKACELARERVFDYDGD